MKAAYVPGQLTIHTETVTIGTIARALRTTGRKVALVPTMGALHAGHLELIKRAGRIPGTSVVVSIFVNPLQFGVTEDLTTYPRSLESDVDLCRSAGVELVFAPPVEQVYPDGPNQITVDPGPLGRELEGASRPGHFVGVLTMVAKLFNILRPDYAFFGEKDYQQLVLVKRMTRELNLGPRVIGVPTVREPDGLAVSSRNVYLNAEQREAAVTLSAALTAGAHNSAAGAEAVLAAAHRVIDSQPLVELDYLELRDIELGPAPRHGDARLLVAARVGTTRLIDNVRVLLPASLRSES